MYKKIEETTKFLKEKVKLNSNPDTGIILGTGLGKLADEIETTDVIPYEDIPNFPLSTIESHKGKLIFGKLGGKNVVAMQGRFHYYEGYSLQKLTFPVRVMKMLGIKQLLISNAAGSMNSSIPKESLMVINDHINLLPGSPLEGENVDEMGPRFPDMSRPYDEKLRELASITANEENISLKNGVYVSVGGPNLETPAEYKYLRTIGADAVGMSTVPEVIVARHAGLPVFAVSVITDECFKDIPDPVTLEEVIEAAKNTEPRLTKLMSKMIEKS